MWVCWVGDRGGIIRGAEYLVFSGDIVACIRLRKVNNHYVMLCAIE